MHKDSIAIIGTRGIPAAHGGFETFAEQLAIFLTRQGIQVTVYCQEDGDGSIREEYWKGIRRVIVPIARTGAVGTIKFDWLCIKHLVTSASPRLVLTLGYNTALFCTKLRMAEFKNIMNMDGIEWKREKWKIHERAWLWINERIGCIVANHLVADHPSIADHLATRVVRSKITTIPYGAHEVTEGNLQHVLDLGLSSNRYACVIARPEPENSILDIVRAFSRRRRNFKLVMLGRYDLNNNLFHRQVSDAASDEVIFPGAIYEREKIEAIRFYCRLYIHGHRVGGTNPSLVEALGCGSAVLAHDNRFNRWVAGEGAHYFSNENDCAEKIDYLLDNDMEIENMKLASRIRYKENFTWDLVLKQYKQLLFG